MPIPHSPDNRLNSAASGVRAITASVWPGALVAFTSLCAWVILIAGDADGTASPGMCGGVLGSGQQVAVALRAFYLLNPPRHLAYHWVLMVVAMMGPALVMTLRRRGDGVDTIGACRSFAFMATYLAVWTAAGALFVPALFLIRSIFPEPGHALGVAIVFSFAWQFTVIRRKCLRNCREVACKVERHPAGPVRGGCAYASCCIGACWPIMLMPSLASGAHLIAMFAATLWILCERAASGSRVARERYLLTRRAGAIGPVGTVGRPGCCDDPARHSGRPGQRRADGGARGLRADLSGQCGDGDRGARGHPACRDAGREPPASQIETANEQGGPMHAANPSRQ